MEKTPNVIESLNFEGILSQMKAELVKKDPNFSALVESDPAIKILEIAAWRELLPQIRILSIWLSFMELNVKVQRMMSI